MAINPQTGLDPLGRTQKELDILDTKSSIQRKQSRLQREAGVSDSSVISPDTITGDSIKTNTPITVVNPLPKTEASGLSGALENITNKDTVASDKAKADASFENVINKILGQSGSASLTDTQFRELGVDKTKKELDALDTDIEAEQLSLRRKLEALDKNPRGLFGGALQDEKDRIKKLSLTKQADLAIIRNSKQRKFDSAKSIADRKVDLLLEDQKNKIEASKLSFQRNENIFTRDEKRAFDENISAKERALNKQEKELKAINDIAIEALKEGASTSAVQQILNAKTQKDAITKSSSLGLIKKPFSTSSLSTAEELQARKLSVDIFGKRAGTKPENFGLVAKLISEGNSVDDIGDMLRTSQFSPEFDGSIRNAVESIQIGLKSKDQRELFANSVDRNLENGDTGAVRASILNGVLVSLDTSAAKKLRGDLRATDLLREISADLSEYESSGGDTGLFRGSIQNIKERVGKVGNEDLAKIGLKIAKAIQRYRSDISGAAFTESETKEYRKIFPSTTNVAKLNTAKIEALLEVLKGDSESTIVRIIGQNPYNDIFPEEVPPTVDGIGGQSNNIQGGSNSSGFSSIIAPFNDFLTSEGL